MNGKKLGKTTLCKCKECNKPFKWYHSKELCRECEEKIGKKKNA